MDNFKQTSDYQLIKKLLIAIEVAILVVSLLPISVANGPFFTTSTMAIIFWNAILPALILLIGSFFNLVFGIRLVRSALKRYYFSSTPWEQSQLRMRFNFLKKLEA